MKISIRTNILIVFILATLTIASILLFSQYYFSKKIALEATQKNFEHLAQTLSKKLAAQEYDMKNVIDVIDDENLFLQPITMNIQKTMIMQLTDIIELKPQIKSVFYVDTQGSFFELLHVNKDSFFSQYEMPQNTKWVAVVIVRDQEKYIYFDKELNLLGDYISQKHYSFLQKEWYKQALQSDDIFISKPYVFTFSNKRGLTYAKKIAPKSVVGIDCMLQSISQMLDIKGLYHSTEIILVDSYGNFIATTRNTQQQSKKVYDISLLDKTTIVQENGVYVYQNITKLKNHDYMIIQVAMKELLAPYKENLLYSLVAALILILLFIPIIFIGTGFLVRPVKKLILENKKIAKREFDKVQRIETNIIEFDALSRSLVEMSQSIQEYQNTQAKLLDSIIQLIAEAIDAKSPYTAGHCKRVPEIALMLLDEVDRSQKEVFKEFHINSKEERKEFELAAWLHDCGKVTTPEYVVDKATKLETIYNRIHEIRMRFEVLLRDAMIAQCKNEISKEEFEAQKQKLLDDFAFIASVNLGGEFLSEEKIKRVHTIAQQKWMRYFDERLGLGENELKRYTQDANESLPVEEMLLSDKEYHKIQRENFDYEAYKQEGFKEEVPEYLYNYGEIYNLCIEKGTLTKEERYKIDEHVIMSIKMLEKIPFPPYYSKIPQYAGRHHETLDGTGYPKRLSEKDLSIPEKIMAIADIFEALTASDRPYKKAKKLSQTLKIMKFMAQEKQIDEELFELFVASGIYKEYAKKHLNPEQIDE